MSGYTEQYRAMQELAIIDRWCPKEEKMPEATPENMRFNIAYRRLAEAELKELRQAISTLIRSTR
jgi:hypothetical protein